MAIIGAFTRTANGNFSGNLKTLTLTAKLQFATETNKSKDSAPTTGSTWALWRSGPCGSGRPRRAGGTTGRSSSTIPHSRRRSTPARSRPRTARASTYCGLAATATDRQVGRAPPAMAGRLPCTWYPARPPCGGRATATSAFDGKLLVPAHPPRGGAARRGIADSAQLSAEAPPLPRRRRGPRPWGPTWAKRQAPAPSRP